MLPTHQKGVNHYYTWKQGKGEKQPFARAWATALHSLLTQQEQHLVLSSTAFNSKAFAIQWQFWTSPFNSSKQNLASPSISIYRNFSSIARLRTHTIEAASASIGSHIGCILAQALTIPPNSFLATTAMEAYTWDTAATTFNLIQSGGGFFNSTVFHNSWPPCPCHPRLLQQLWSPMS